MRVLILDTETTGLDPKVNRVIEVCSILYDLDYHKPLETFQKVFYCDNNPVQNINGLSEEFLATLSDRDQGIDHLLKMAQDADCIVAHNAKFDQNMMMGTFQTDLGKPWVCSRTDIEIPGAKGKRLGHIAYDLGLTFIAAHTAMADVQVLCQILSHVPNIKEQISKHLNSEPKKKYYIRLDYSQTAMRQKVKDLGFSWDAQSKVWVKDMDEEQVKSLDFAVMEVSW